MLNFARFWYVAKFYTCENCEYNLNDLCKAVLKALNLVIIPVIFHYYQYCMRIMNAYCLKLGYETKQFIKTVHNNHRQVVNKSKW